MKTIIIGLLFIGPIYVLAWGPTGHRAIGHIAEQYLSIKAKKKISVILEGQSLAIVSTWMDEVRSDRKYDHWEDWHWVTVPDGETYEESAKNKNGDIIQAIEATIMKLKNNRLTVAEQSEQIKILAHLVGDIHQPLHVGTGTDKGGNEVKVKWFGQTSNLHGVWDSGMIDRSRLSYTELAQSLGRPPKSNILLWQQTNVWGWATESMKLRGQVYAIGDGKLGYEYSYQHWDTVKLRLLQAGVRLARILNEIYG